MEWMDAGYVTAAALAGGLGRALRRGLPAGWRQRLEARPPEELAPGWIWLHAVSVGELMLAEGIVGWLREQDYRVHVTTGTPAGLELLRRRLPGWDRETGRITGGAFPLDDPAGLKPFLSQAPAAFVALETELWPNLLRSLEARGIPRAIVNGRLTARSLEKGRRLMRRAAERLSVVAARDEASAEAFRRLGASRVELGGNLKADLPPPVPLHEGWEPLRLAWREAPVLVAGNTVEGEEDLVLEAWTQARRERPELRLILAPRQPKRFQEVAASFKAKGLRFRRASGIWPADQEAWRDCEVLLLDTLGELPSAYREGTLALVGGGWSWEGGHNPLEPARWGVPTLIGPGYRNFEDLVEPLRAAGRVEIAPSAELGTLVGLRLAEAPLRPGGNLVDLPPALKGALGRSCAILGGILPPVR